MPITAQTSADNPSAEYTITMHPGTLDVLRQIRTELAASAVALNKATNHEDLAERQRAHILLLESHICTLHQVLSTTRHDGDQHLYPDHLHPLSLGFRYAGSGYTGGLIFWARSRHWAIHT